ncbi:MAG: trigger factor [Clostridia bacterium]|nr:trigger factor [Clostridia bacterium]
MKYTHAAGEKSTVKLTITFTEEEWQDAINESYKRTRGKYSVPGFRKGKVPKPVLENYYGKSVLFEEAFNVLYSKHYSGILEKEKDNFTAVGEPSLAVEDLTEGKGLVLSAVVPVKPEVNIEKYTGLKIQQFEYNVSDADVDKEANKILESNAEMVEVTDRACKLGDTVNIDFSGSVANEKFPGGTADDYNLELGSGSFIAGFEDGVVGMKIGETKDLKVKFPDDYQADNLRGKDAVFTVVLHKITEKKLPDLTDEYVKKHAGAETVADYKKTVRERLERNAENRGRDETENSIVTEICKHATCEIPDAMIESEIDRMVQDFNYRLMYQGLKLDDYLKYMELTMEQFRAQFKEQAQPRVLSQLVIDKIIRTEGIKADDKEVDAKIEEQAKSVGKTLAEYKKNIDPRQVEYITNDVIITKLFDFLKKNNEMYTEGGKPVAKKTAAKPAAKTATADKSEKTEKPATAKKPAAKKPAAKKD